MSSDNILLVNDLQRRKDFASDRARQLNTLGDIPIFYSKFTAATLRWNESTLPEGEIGRKVLATIRFQQIVTGLKFFPITFDDGATFKSPARTDLFLYGGIDRVDTMFYAFRYVDYLRTGGGFANLPAPIPVSLLISVNVLSFVVDYQLSASNSNSALTGNTGTELEQTRNAAVNGVHYYGFRIHSFIS